MRYKLIILLCLLNINLACRVQVVEKHPPSSAVIFQTIEQLWSTRKFKKLDKYIKELEKSWKGYVPAEIALAIYSYQYGAQVEGAIERLETIRDGLQNDIILASPIFMSLLDGRILRYNDIKNFYFKNGISREERLKERHPFKKTKFKHAPHWGEEMLFFNAPEIFLTGEGHQATVKEITTIENFVLEQIPEKTLLMDMCNEQIAMPERKVFARELIHRQAATGGISNLVQSFYAAYSVYTYQDAVDELVKSGEEASPALLEYINSLMHGSERPKMAIWALVRIGIADDEVIQTLQSITTHTIYPDLAQYARDALQYLQDKDK